LQDAFIAGITSEAIQINIRNVPERVRDELAARAALQGKSMQEFLRAELAEALKLPLATLDEPLSKSNGITCKFLTPRF
jgi:plasmid stability protein